MRFRYSLREFHFETYILMPWHCENRKQWIIERYLRMFCALCIKTKTIRLQETAIGGLRHRWNTPWRKAPLVIRLRAGRICELSSIRDFHVQQKVCFPLPVFVGSPTPLHIYQCSGASNWNLAWDSTNSESASGCDIFTSNLWSFISAQS
jgi:hypothetical protein